MLLAHEGELCGRELDPQCFSSNGPFSRSTTCTTHYSQKKKKKRTAPWTKSAYEMKEVGSCSPNSEALEDYALLIDVGFIGQKLTRYKPTTMGLEQLLPYGSDFFFFDKHSDLIEYAGTTIICNYDFYGCILVL